jgi:hypothetical protein
MRLPRDLGAVLWIAGPEEEVGRFLYRDIALPGNRDDSITLLLDLEGLSTDLLDFEDSDAIRDLESHRRRCNGTLGWHANRISLLGTGVRLTWPNTNVSEGE